jgi:DNA-binding PadR family transcriptional regulator
LARALRDGDPHVRRSAAEALRRIDANVVRPLIDEFVRELLDSRNSQSAPERDLEAKFEVSVGHFWSADLSQVDPTLKRMQKRGWLTSKLAPSKRGPARRVYTRTAAGASELRAWVTGDPVVGTERFAYLVQLWALGETGDPAETAAFLQKLRAHLDGWRLELTGMEAAWRADDPRVPDALSGADLHAHMCLRFGITALEAKVTWCDECLARVAQPSRSARRRTAKKGRSDG